VAKAAVCKTVIHQFESGCRLHNNIKGLQVISITCRPFLLISKFNVHHKARYILVTDTKTSENRTVPINDTLASILKSRLDDDTPEYVFCNHEGRKLT